MRKVKSGGGWQAIRYVFQKGREAGGIWKLYKAMRAKNACKTCALGMGGQRGGMVNEAGRFPEVCKKSVQAMAADMQPAIASEFFEKNSIDELARLTPRELEACGRITSPLLMSPGERHYRPVSWEEANRRIAAKLRETTPDETFWYVSGRSSNEAGFLLHVFARLYGTNNVNNCSYYCHQASGVGLTSVTGSGTATITLEDLERADLVFLIGGNPASNHPRLMRSLMDVRRSGGRVIVINPVVETGLVNFRVPSDVQSLLFGSKIATQYVQPHIGGDLALLTGIAKRILEMNEHDPQFLENYCTGWPELRDRLHEVSWNEIVAKSGVEYDEINEIAATYAESERAVFSWTMGITHHVDGVQNVQAIGNLALLRGMVGKPGAGLMPIRGHSNVQGVGSVGVTPKLKDAVLEKLESRFNVQLPTTPGMDTLSCLEAAGEGKVRLGICLGGNLYGASPDAQFAQEALARLEMLVYVSTTLNTGHALGIGKETIILPALARDEEAQSTTQESMFNYVRLSDGGPARHTGPRSEIDIIAELAASTLEDGSSPIDWNAMRDAEAIRETISAIVPGWEKIGNIGETKQEFQIDGRTFHEPKFATADGRARVHVHSLPELAGDENTLRLMTVRSEGQFNTVVYEEYDLYRGIERRDVIGCHPEDIERFGLNAEETVTVRSETGEMRGIIVHPLDEIRPGNALMYYPEANVLVSRSHDPLSKTPAYKNVVVQVEPEGRKAEEHEPALAKSSANSRDQMRAC